MRRAIPAFRRFWTHPVRRIRRWIPRDASLRFWSRCPRTLAWYTFCSRTAGAGAAAGRSGDILRAVRTDDRRSREAGDGAGIFAIAAGTPAADPAAGLEMPA